MPPLDRALALTEREDLAARVGENLDLDVPGGPDDLLDVEGRIAERGLGFRGCRPERAFELRVVLDDPHPLAAAAGRGLEQDGVAELLGKRMRTVDLNGVCAAGDDGHVGARHLRLRLHLVADSRHHLGAGADEDEVVVLARGDEGGVLGEEPVTGMDRVTPRGGRSGDHGRDVQIALRGLRRPDGHGSVGKPDVEGVAVGGRVDRDRLDLELVQPPDHAHRDLAAVRHQHTLEHQRPSGRPLIGSSSKSNWPYSTGSALPTWMARTTASWSALTSFISFIASRTQSVCPGATASPSSTKGGAPGCGAR